MEKKFIIHNRLDKSERFRQLAEEFKVRNLSRDYDDANIKILSLLVSLSSNSLNLGTVKSDDQSVLKTLKFTKANPFMEDEVKAKVNVNTFQLDSRVKKQKNGKYQVFSSDSESWSQLSEERNQENDSRAQSNHGTYPEIDKSLTQSGGRDNRAISLFDKFNPQSSPNGANMNLSDEKSRLKSMMMGKNSANYDLNTQSAGLTTNQRTKTISDFTQKSAQKSNPFNSFSKTDATFMDSVRQAAIHGGLPFSVKELKHGTNPFNDQTESIDPEFLHSVRYGKKNTLNTLSTRMETLNENERFQQTQGTMRIQETDPKKLKE